MVDTLHPSTGKPPAGWPEAFAALPLEAPPPDGWARLSRDLDRRAPRVARGRRERRINWIVGVASAAVLAIVVASPFLSWERGAPSTPQDTVASTPQKATLATPRPGGESTAGVRESSASPVRVAEIASTPRKAPPAAERRQATPAPQPAASDAPVVTQVAGAIGEPARETTTTEAAADTLDIPQLQSQSVQLEALVALARDDRAGSASSALITAELDASIADIDTALSQAGLSTGERASLWRQRVDTLQQLASMETTERWLASQGALYDTALVSID